VQLDGQIEPSLLLGAPLNAGYYVEGEYCPDPKRFFPWQEREHEVLRFVRLMKQLGLPDCGTDLEFPITAEERDAVKRFGLPPHGYACVHPGSQLPSRRWAPDRFAQVADSLAGEGYRIVLTGTAGEAPLTQAVKAAMKSAATDLTGRTSLGELAALVKRAALVVCNDTGISHIAAAVKTPSVVVSCGADVERWRPLDRELHTVLYHAVPCRPCAHTQCPLERHRCAEGIDVLRVITAAKNLFQRQAVPT
jgi:ADP-heptose:LPS heptosyltransferase